MDDIETWPQRALRPAVLMLLVIAWFGGGPTVDVTAVDEWIELLALPVLALGVAAWSGQPASGRSLQAGFALALLIACVPLLQLIPLPDGAWALPEARAALASDLQAAGITAQGYPWSLMPAATERALWALLPALACFVGVLALPAYAFARLPQLALALILANLAFGFLQVGLPPDSALRLYPETGSGFGGVLVNDNHQGTALVIGMLLALGLWAHTRMRRRRGETLPLRAPAYAACMVLCLVAVPLTGSRAAMLIALVLLALGCVATGIVPLRRIGRSRRATVTAVLVACAVSAGLLLAWQWMQVDAADELRQVLAGETARLGVRHAPLGSGMGSFVEVFAQGGSPRFQQSEYVNHAHNEYVQWWLEGGVAGLLAMLAGLSLFAWAGVRLLRDGRHHPLPVAAWLAVLAVLLHSSVDFPLRTLSVMTLVSVLAGYALQVAAGMQARGSATSGALQLA